MELGSTPKIRRGQDSICLHEGRTESGTTTGHPDWKLNRKDLYMEIYLKIDRIVKIYKKIAKMAFMGQEIVRKQQRHNLS